MGVERLKLLQMKKNFIHKKVDTMVIFDLNLIISKKSLSSIRWR